MASTQLDGKTVAFLTAQEGIEEVELTEPWKAVKDAGATPKLIAPESVSVQWVGGHNSASSNPGVWSARRRRRSMTRGVRL